MLSPGRYPEYDEPELEDGADWLSSWEPDPFGRHEHALEALRAGDVATAIQTVAECATSDRLANSLAHEAEDLLRARRIADAELLLTRAAKPKFSSVRDARGAYGAVMAASRHRRLVDLLAFHNLEFAP
ncbi:hypothetical protein [Methylobacterium sp. ARG-1]|uniref:hypothetical protein n=1 Tax=Methylobacterium sp. ARG-1 TaxID=1692501 RepID=UPI0006835199|nr:hypothetical protein [Methylobacterium sp. ARG-1]KNY20378.1 hypothetical protein AKJ13_22375 [Methylobacterium sp. ARG-1]